MGRRIGVRKQNQGRDPRDFSVLIDEFGNQFGKVGLFRVSQGVRVSYIPKKGKPIHYAPEKESFARKIFDEHADRLRQIQALTEAYLERLEESKKLPTISRIK